MSIAIILSLTCHFKSGGVSDYLFVEFTCVQIYNHTWGASSGHNWAWHRWQDPELAANVIMRWSGSTGGRWLQHPPTRSPYNLTLIQLLSREGIYDASPWSWTDLWLWQKPRCVTPEAWSERRYNLPLVLLVFAHAETTQWGCLGQPKLLQHPCCSDPSHRVTTAQREAQASQNCPVGPSLNINHQKLCKVIK